MTARVRRLALVVGILFAALIANLSWIAVFRADHYINSSSNPRLVLDSYSRQRGPILAGDEQVAKSVETSSETLKYLRTYPGGATYAPMTGFFSLVYGATQVEQAENSFLAGDDDRLFGQKVADLFAGRQPSGGAVQTTIVPAVQKAAYDGLAGRRGAAVAIDPRTGAVLALASSPSYDPTLLSSHDRSAIQANYQKLIDDPDQPMLNRPISRTYPPGSTFKVVVSAAALATGDYTPETEVPAPTSYQLPGSTKTISGDCNSPPTMTLEDALAVSCNTAFAMLAIHLGADAVQKQAEAFGFNDDSLRIPMKVAQSVFPTGIDEAQLGLAGIGQGDVQATAMQMAMVAEAIANNGDQMQPYVVQQLLRSDLSVVDETKPKVLRRPVTADVAAQLTQMMQAVVAGGTGTSADIPGVAVAGKTGTAQNAPGAPAHAWFMGFAPADGDAKVAVAVVLENSGGSGGRVAAPIARNMMEAALGQ